MEQLGSHWADFHEIWYLSIFKEYVEYFQLSLKSDKNNGYLILSPSHIFDHISFLHGMRNIPGKVCIEKQNTHFIFYNLFFPQSCLFFFLDNVEKYLEPGMPRMET